MTPTSKSHESKWRTCAEGLEINRAWQEGARDRSLYRLYGLLRHCRSSLGRRLHLHDSILCSRQHFQRPLRCYYAHPPEKHVDA